MATKRFDGKVVIITGSSSGIGADVAVRFAKGGAAVSLTGRDNDALNKVAAECQATGAKVVTTVGDITLDETRSNIVKNTIDAWGKIDILINNAGMGGVTTILHPNHDQFDQIINVNVRSVYRLTTEVAPYLIKTKGNIVNISSVLSRRTDYYFSAYCMSKAAIDMFTMNAAEELAPYQVRVNAVNPAVFETQIFQRSLKLKAEEVAKHFDQTRDAHALGRNGRLDELSNLILFLASDEASFVTGSHMLIDGGLCIKSNNILTKSTDSQ